MSDQNNRNPDDIEADIGRTRTQLGDDVEAITYQLSPERYREQLKERTKGVQSAVTQGLTGALDGAGARSKQAGRGFLERMEDDPLPIVLAALGVGVLAIGGAIGGSRGSASQSSRGSGNRGEVGLEYPSDDYSQSSSTTRNSLYNSPDGPNYGRTIGDSPNAGALSGDQDLPTEGVDEYDYTSGGNRGNNSDTENYQREARRQAYQTKRGLVRLIGDHPLATGAIITLTGVIAGLSVPSSRQEDELMGRESDKFKAKAQRAAHQAEDVAAKSYQSAKETTKKEVDKQDLNEGRESSRNAGAKVQNVAEEAAREAKDTAEAEAEKKDSGR